LILLGLISLSFLTIYINFRLEVCSVLFFVLAYSSVENKKLKLIAKLLVFIFIVIAAWAQFNASLKIANDIDIDFY